MGGLTGGCGGKRKNRGAFRCSLPLLPCPLLWWQLRLWALSEAGRCGAVFVGACYSGAIWTEVAWGSSTTDSGFELGTDIRSGATDVQLPSFCFTTQKPPCVISHHNMPQHSGP